jgi:FAD/FMN-containing dehydrogenase/Fe-S oxidoreductase
MTQPGEQDRAFSVDVDALQRRLRARVGGEVRFDAGTRGAYATDASNYRQLPLGVVLPHTPDDAVATLETCREHGAPVVSRGGGTSLAGQATNAGVVVDWSKFQRDILELDADRRRARVRSGAILDDLRRAARPHGLTFGPDPATHDRCTLGGMIGNNACGIRSITAGRTCDNVDELEVATVDGLRITVGPTSDAELERRIAAGGRQGELYAGMKRLVDRHAPAIRAAYPDVPRRVSGYNLDELLPENGFNVARALVGTEGTCAAVLSATCRLVAEPAARSLLVVGFPSIERAADHAAGILAWSPIGLEALDGQLVAAVAPGHPSSSDRALLPRGHAWLLVEFGGDTNEQAHQRARACRAGLGGDVAAPSVALLDDPAAARRVWQLREAALGLAARLPGRPMAWPGWEDSAVPPAALGDYLRDLRRLLAEHGYPATIYGHFGDGCVHCRLPFDLRTAAGRADYEAFVHRAADLVVAYGGSLSGEHGDGQARGQLLSKMFGDELVGAMREFKALWDPDGAMNPGKVVEPAGLTEHLRLGADYRPLPMATDTHFAFPDDGGSLAQAALRCVGVGKCRRTEAGTMCPSYMATLDEQHSTRGRARLLFEMLQGDSPVSGWRSEAVRDALDLCLACKGCKTECPVNVDMATYKAEFLAHHYKGRLRPRQAYALGLIPWTARVAAAMPDVVNAVTHTPGVSWALKALAGVAPGRDAPRFARRTFTEWFQDRGRIEPGAPGAGDRPPVVLWPDTFTNHYHPEVGKATVEVLEACGYRVELAPGGLCCGRPLYDYGMLDLARRQLSQILEALRPWLQAGVPVVGMEPSCLTVFRDELVNLWPHDEDARRLSCQALMLTELLARDADAIAWPRLPRPAVVHGHCHQAAIMGMEADRAVLSRLELDYEVLDSGCCGMAGAFGFEQGHQAVSVACAERRLLPAARRAHDEGTLVITSGYSCREQVAQLTGLRPVHTHEVLRAAFTDGDIAAPLEGAAGPGPALRANWPAAAAAGALAAAVVGRRAVAG